MRPPLLVFAALGLVVITAAPRPADASVTVALSLDDLMDRSERVVLGHALGSISRWDGDQIVTEITVEVDEPVVGDRRTLVLRALGGSVGSVGMRVEGAARIPDGARAIVFARQRAGALRPVGMSQGVLPVAVTDAGEVVRPGGAGQALMRRIAPGRLIPAPGALLHERPLDELMGELHAMAASRRP